MALVSIVVPIYKVEEYLERCVCSLQKQTYSDIEILLVDDGSPDRCGLMCDEYAALDERIHVIHKENGGLGDARNVGASYAQGKYLLFIDSDDWVHKDLVKHTVEIAESNSADLVMFDYESVGADESTGDVFSFDLPTECVLSARTEPRLIMCSCSAVNKLYRREFWVNSGVKFPKGRYYEDLGTIPKLMALAERVVYKKETLYYYFMRESSIMHSKDFSRNYEDRTAVVEGVLTFYREHRLYERYKKELEYLTFENAYFLPSKEIVLNDIKSIYLEKFKSYAYKKFPDLEHNIYVKELSRKNKILLLLLKRKLYRGMLLLSYARRAKDFIWKAAGGRRRGVSQRGGSGL